MQRGDLSPLAKSRGYTANTLPFTIIHFLSKNCTHSVFHRSYYQELKPAQSLPLNAGMVPDSATRPNVVATPPCSCIRLLTPPNCNKAALSPMRLVRCVGALTSWGKSGKQVGNAFLIVRTIMAITTVIHRHSFLLISIDSSIFPTCNILILLTSYACIVTNWGLIVTNWGGLS